MKRIKIFFIMTALALLPAGQAAAGITAAGAAVLDGSGAQRTTFTNLETIALRQVVTNSAQSSDRIRFKFTIYNPAGGAVFHHEGNSAGGVPGIWVSFAIDADEYWVVIERDPLALEARSDPGGTARHEAASGRRSHDERGTQVNN